MSEASKIWNCGFYLQKSKNEDGLRYFVFDSLFCFFTFFDFVFWFYLCSVESQFSFHSLRSWNSNWGGCIAFHFVLIWFISFQYVSSLHPNFYFEILFFSFLFSISFISLFIFLEPNRIVITSVFKHLFEFKFRFIYFLVFLYSFFLWNLLSFSWVCIQSWF